MYTKEVKLNHNEIACKLNVETGVFKKVNNRPNNIPEGKSINKIDKFFKMNVTLINKLKSSGLLNMEEIGIITYMSTIAEWNTNSLKPLNNDTSSRMLEDFFLISKNRVKKVLDRLFKLGVYMQVKIHKDDLVDYWVLNPNISWKGTLAEDSIFLHFEGTVINSLL
jgi:hypothetical protein